MPAACEHSNSTLNAQEANLFRNLSAQVKSGRLNPLWPEIGLKTQQVMAAVHESATRPR